MAGNDQQLPPGLGGGASVPQVPNTPAGTSVINMPNPTPRVTQEQYQQQFVQPAPVLPTGQEPPAPVHHPNPMLQTLAPPAPVTAQPVAPAPVLPTPPVVPEAPKPTAPTGVADLAGALGADPMLAPGIAYLEAAATAADLDVQRAFGNAADELDARFIDRAYLVEKVGQAQADQMIKVAESSIQFAATTRENMFAECRAVAGDAGQWDQAVALFNQHADAETKAAIGGMFDSMNKSQMLYAAKQLVQFAASTGGVVQPGVQPLGAPGTVTGMSMEEYRGALANLPRNAPDSAYETLRAQRAAGMKQGR